MKNYQNLKKSKITEPITHGKVRPNWFANRICFCYFQPFARGTPNRRAQQREGHQSSLMGS
jgi:hypothetical protein